MPLQCPRRENETRREPFPLSRVEAVGTGVLALIGLRAPPCTQETFLRVYRALPSFSLDGPARLSTWILTLATRLALNALRRPSGRGAGGQARAGNL